MNGLQMEESTITSMEVAEMIGKEHKNLMRDIKRYVKQMGQANNEAKIEPVKSNELKVEPVKNATLKIEPGEFFQESTYVDSKGEARPCYLITKKGCEFIAHKLTGQKGTEFTARYINRFHEMEDAIQYGLLETKTASTAIPEVSSTLVPKIPDWYSRNRRRLQRLCNRFDTNHRELYHVILKKLGREYDIRAAREIYLKERGYYPEYPIDIVGYFPELAEKADAFLDRLEGMENSKI